MKKKLYLSTVNFPYSDVGRTFIQSELCELAKKYDVTIIAHADHASAVKEISEMDLPSEVKVVNVSIQLTIMKVIFYFFKYIFDVDGWKEIIDICKQHKKFFFMLYQSIIFYSDAMENWRLLSKKDLFDKNQEFIYYSFWYSSYTYSMTRYKKKYKNIKIITRVHGVDLYDERWQCGRQPFKKIMDERLDKIIFACNYAKNYYENKKYSTDVTRYIVSKIGAQPALAGVAKEKGMHNIIVSCSRIVKLKRLSLIIDSLCVWEHGEIEWHHFGSGEEAKRIEEYAHEKLDGHPLVNYHLHGDTSNENILKFYADHEIMCFVTTSSTEGGVPVSIQEAMAYGIPIIGTDVGGITEAISENGILLKKNPTAEEIKRAIENILMHPDEREKMCKASVEMWSQEYCAEKNAHHFLKLIEDNL